MKIHHPFERFVQHGIPDASTLSRIAEFHFIPVNQIAQSVPLEIGSCYRSKGHETAKGRKPNGTRKFWSTHTFDINDRDPEGKGAIDLSSNNLRALMSLVEMHMKPSRIALYSWGVHVDYCYPDRGLRYFDSSWNELTRTEFYARL
jgi:hypothetical protein